MISMIFTLYIIDADNSVLVFEKAFQPLKKPATKENSDSLGSGVIAEFFAAINIFIDEIQAAMKKGRDISNMNRTLLAENSTVCMHYQPEARVLITAISDPDDDTDIIIQACKKIGERFVIKHKDHLERFRTSMDSEPFLSFIPDVEMILRDGKVAECFPVLQIPQETLQRIMLMGVITKEEYQVANMLDGKTTSPYFIAKKLGKTKDEIMGILKKFAELDIIKRLNIPKF